MILNFKKFSDNAKIPTKSHNNDAGLDFYAPYDIIIIPNASINVPLDIGWEPVDIPQLFQEMNVYLQIKGRSGLSMKYGIEVCNAGVVDQNYTGNITVKLYNWGKDQYYIAKGNRIAQGIVHLIPKYSIQEATELSESDRGTNGFGSTGK